MITLYHGVLVPVAVSLDSVNNHALLASTFRVHITACIMTLRNKISRHGCCQLACRPASKMTPQSHDTSYQPDVSTLQYRDTLKALSRRHLQKTVLGSPNPISSSLVNECSPQAISSKSLSCPWYDHKDGCTILVPARSQ